MQKNLNNLTYKNIKNTIDAIIYYGNEQDIVIFTFGEFFIQFLGGKGYYDLFCEAISNNYLEEETYLNENQIKKLLELGWQEPQTPDDNFYLIHPIEYIKEREKLIQLFIKTISIYGDYKISFEDVILT